MLDLSRVELDSSLVFIAFLALFSALLTLRAHGKSHRLTRPISEEGFELAGANVAALLAASLATGEFLRTLPIFLICVASAASLRYFVHRLSMPGILWLTGVGAGALLGGLWSALFIVEASLPPVVEILAFVALGFSLLFFAINQIALFAREAVVTHERWRLPHQPADPAMAFGYRPRVSLQLPCYAEPPEVVIETMNRLAALDYDNYEVIVIDNNTKDESLWRPLEAHAARLNAQIGEERFRFFHVAPLDGAKAGALNWLLDGRMDPKAELIGVIDADYYSTSDFLSRLVPFFADPQIGYLQTPHDYRDYEANSYLTACYWEYMPTNKADYPGISEYGGAFTIGTMCLLRTEALVKAGGWAEWCLTEDSEVSVRIRAAGYRGYYFNETFGRGLIPDTFDDYKKQRFRWTAGPVQQLRRHWRLFLPSPLAPAMPGWTKLLEVVRCISPLQMLASYAMAVFGLVAMIVALATGAMEPIAVPSIAGLMLVLGGITWWVRTMHRYHLAGCHDTEDMIRGEIARASLSYVTLVAGLAGLSKRPHAWRRTPKFANQAAEPSPFTSTMTETILAGALMLVAFAMLMAGGLIGSGVALLSFVGLGSLGVQFLCAPIMAEMGIRRRDPRRMQTPRAKQSAARAFGPLLPASEPSVVAVRHIGPPPGSPSIH